MISWRKFSLNDIVLFLPLPKKTENRAYLAFHEGCPHHYLSAESTEWFRKANKNSYPHYIVGKIILVDELEAGPIGNLASNPYSIPEGTKFHVLTVESVTSLTRRNSRRSSGSSGSASGAGAGASASASSGAASPGKAAAGGGGAAAASPTSASPTAQGSLSPSGSIASQPYPALPNWGAEGGGASEASAAPVPLLSSPPTSPSSFAEMGGGASDGGGGSGGGGGGRGDVMDIPSRSATPEAERLDQAEGHG